MKSILENNLEALSIYNKEFSNYLRNLELSDQSFVLSRTGKIVPQQICENKLQALHSLYDPEKEALRVLEEYEKIPCLCLLGFGGGFMVKEALKSPSRELVTLWEPLPETSWGILKNVDFTNEFSDPRFRILSKSADLKSWYNPVLMGSFRVLSLLALERINQEIFNSLKSDLQSILEEIKDDQSTQGKLGLRWINHTWKNLEKIENCTLTFPENKKIWIVGAGPSLEIQIKEYVIGDLLFSTDTALPYLRALGLEPTLVITMDPQIYSYLHFLPYGSTTLFLGELGVFPTLARYMSSSFFFFSYHPLHIWLREQGLNLPFLETRTGNVVGTLLDLADSLHPKEIVLAGVDLSFPQGKIYARGTYQFDYHNKNTTRLTPLENIQIQQIFSSETEVRFKDFHNFIYRTPLQKAYSKRLKIQGHFSKMTIPKCLSLTLEINSLEQQPEKKNLNNNPMDITKLKSKYYTEVCRLKPELPLLLWQSKLNQDELLVWNTLVPWLTWKVFHGQEIIWENWSIIWQELKTILMIEG